MKDALPIGMVEEPTAYTLPPSDYLSLDAQRVVASYSAAQMQAAYAAGLQASSKALNYLLSQLDEQAGNGMIPWQIEDAFDEYQSAVQEPLK